VLILYTDDSEPYTQVVTELAALLETDGNACVLFDQWALTIDHPNNTRVHGGAVSTTPTASNLHPTQWLMQCLEERALNVLVLFSDCSQRVLLGERLKQRVRVAIAIYFIYCLAEDPKL